MNNRDNGDYMVTVCSDDILSDTKIDSAQNIIHYSLPNNWTKFTKRFALFFKYYSNSFVDEVSLVLKIFVFFIYTFLIFFFNFRRKEQLNLFFI